MRLPRRWAALATVAALLLAGAVVTGAVRVPGLAYAEDAWDLAYDDHVVRFEVEVDPAYRVDTHVEPSPQQVATATAQVGLPARLVHEPSGATRVEGPGGSVLLDTTVPVPAVSGGRVTEAYAAQLRGISGVRTVSPLAEGRLLLGVEEGAFLLPQQLPGVAGAARAQTSALADVPLPDDPRLGAAWALHNTGHNPGAGTRLTAGADLGALAAWERTRGSGVVVAVLDSGFADHRDTRAALWTDPGEPCGDVDADGDGHAGACHGWNFLTGTPDVTNADPADPARNLHGTMVGGVLAAATGNGLDAGGIAPDARVMPLVVAAGATVYTSLVPDAIVFAVDHGASVVTLSFGGSLSGAGLDALRGAVGYAASRGVLLVAAAGNDGEDRDASPLYPASLTEDNVLTVGASTGTDGRASFSAYGARSVDVFAPGVSVLAPGSDGTLRRASGTSLAAPLAAGVAALVRSADPALTAAEVRTRLMSTAARRPGLVSGSGGRVDARAAVSGLGAPPAPPVPVLGPAPAPVPVAPSPPAAVTTERVVLTGLRPTTSSTAGGDLITITGTGLPPRARVTIGGVTARVVLDGAPTSVTVRAPARVTGRWDVVVSGRTSTVTLPGAVTYLPPR